MLTLKLISEQTERVVRGLEKKHFPNAQQAINEVLAIDKKRREAQQELDKSLNEQKQLSGQIGRLMKEGKKDEAEQVKAQVAELKEKSKQLDETMAKAQEEMTTLLAEANKAGYTEIMPPTVVNAASGYGTGQLPDKEGQMYHCEVDNFYLIPTAEVPVTNIYRDVILDEKDLPIKNCAYTECFRREAGSYGKDVRGLNRLHEFSKIEIVRIDKPEHSKESHKEMLEHVEGLLKKLELPYRILLLCGGDQSFTSAICYDFEVYSEAQGRWLEVSSVSNFDTYQANRLKCRYRPEGSKKPELCHTLNGSALALPRIVAALLENNQTENGIKIPAALVPYMGCDIIN